MTTMDRAAAAHACMLDGTPPLLLICSGSGETLSACSRDLVRGLRREGARVEFHVPGDAEALLQAINRLLADVPLDRSLDNAQGAPPHILVVDEGESLAEPETASLRRMVQGLRGSCFRVVVLVKRSAASIASLPVSGIVDLALLWDADGRGEEPVLDPVIDTVPDPVTAELPLEEVVSVPAADGPIPDVLADLARERAETRGFDVTSSRRWTMSPTKIVVTVIMFLSAGIAVDAMLTDEAPAGPSVYDCGLHPDREAVDVLLARIDRSLPTQVTAESGQLRLRVGPFNSAPAAESARAQVWRLGACRIAPDEYPVAVAPDRTAGG